MLEYSLNLLNPSATDLTEATTSIEPQPARRIYMSYCYRCRQQTDTDFVKGEAYCTECDSIK